MISNLARAVFRGLYKTVINSPEVIIRNGGEPIELGMAQSLQQIPEDAPLAEQHDRAVHDFDGFPNRAAVINMVAEIIGASIYSAEPEENPEPRVHLLVDERNSAFGLELVRGSSRDIPFKKGAEILENIIRGFALDWKRDAATTRGFQEKTVFTKRYPEPTDRGYMAGLCRRYAEALGLEPERHVKEVGQMKLYISPTLYKNIRKHERSENLEL